MLKHTLNLATTAAGHRSATAAAAVRTHTPRRGVQALSSPIAHLTGPRRNPDGTVPVPREMTAAQAARLIESNQRVFISSVCSAPADLIQAMTDRHAELRNVELTSIHTEGPAPYLDPKFAGSFRLNCMFTGANARAAPDRHGYCSLGTSVDVTKAAVESARVVIAEVNPNMPRAHGDGLLHVSQLDALVHVDRPLVAHDPVEPDEVESKIGALVASLVENGACLQMGIGAIPNAVLGNLKSHQNLGIHTEMFSDGMLDLFDSGAITNTQKTIRPGVIVSGFVLGSRKLYEFLDDNPLINMLDISFVNDTAVIRQNSRATAINSAIEVDLTGQVCADSIGTLQFSGIGGQMDFVRGATLSAGGKAIIALPSTTKKGLSRIVTTLHPGAGVVTTRGHVQYIVTEYGIAYLYGKNMRQRARALIDIAHPSHREALFNDAVKRFGPLDL
ncbi:acetyl-CoA hydrolase/transferase [Capsaspora owczarzaki ATCC 30864]|uniref:Acetyl-CoA hydrolase/transferase n=1 Tax=Capsaspora owczarzaki (strain ATCC 30864) TaxID=595528 RepID=A0A0D2VGF3_CAPO3|nr:acetyl-CoA hydrolase/transferase [Capsaspora owczarzaki ATCC 30864]KJE88952.1 acetyl-CoA hydrolase/transferase [Capsaspora owczarzaki ATCC 30864]|eukprot:XP_004365389.1 acetyl-CoA hydrolase/transferase [Capsaspora owczarzaki ATCC 30864]